jgi:hypothetical protein
MAINFNAIHFIIVLFVMIGPYLCAFTHNPIYNWMAASIYTTIILSDVLYNGCFITLGESKKQNPQKRSFVMRITECITGIDIERRPRLKRALAIGYDTITYIHLLLSYWRVGHLNIGIAIIIASMIINGRYGTSWENGAP